jgi:hypothetical protein
VFANSILLQSSLSVLFRVKKVQVGRIRAVEKLSYAEAVKKVEAASRDDAAMAVGDSQQLYGCQSVERS